MTNIILILLLFHFVVDFVFQRHETAINKGKDRMTLLGHSLIYGLAMYMVFSSVVTTEIDNEYGVLVYVFFAVSHYFIDSGFPIVMWAKFIHQNPLFENVYTLKDGKEAILKDCLENPFRPAIYIAIDQIFHILVIVGIGVFVI